MKIIVIHKNQIQKRPPVISSLLILADLGHEVTLITTGINDFWKNELRRRGIMYHIVIDNKYKFPFLSKILNYKEFGKGCFQIIKSIIKNRHNGLVWVESAYTMMALSEQLKDYNYVLQIQELHEKSKLQQKYIDKLIHDAKAVFMPEYNRTLLYKVWYNLEKTPVVLPNKPYILLSNEDAEKVIKDNESVLTKLKDKKIILYQGGISRTRMLDKICQAIILLNNDYHLLLVGPEQTPGIIDELKSITPEITHIKFIPAPNHLAFCKIAHIGFVFYAPESLNNLYCAPNKIFEYSAYGLPMLGNDIPGLRYTIGINQAGVTVNPESVDDIADGIKRIERDYNIYQEKTRLFYQSVDNKQTISEIINTIQL